MKNIYLALILVLSFKNSFSQNKSCLHFTNPSIISKSTTAPIRGCFEVSNLSYNLSTDGKNANSGVISFEMLKDEANPIVWLEYLKMSNPISFEISFMKKNEDFQSIIFTRYKFKNAYVNSFENSDPKNDKIAMFVGAYHIEYIENPNSGSEVSHSIGRDFLLNTAWNGL